MYQGTKSLLVWSLFTVSTTITACSRRRKLSFRNYLPSLCDCTVHPLGNSCQRRIIFDPPSASGKNIHSTNFSHNHHLLVQAWQEAQKQTTHSTQRDVLRGAHAAQASSCFEAQLFFEPRSSLLSAEQHQCHFLLPCKLSRLLQPHNSVVIMKTVMTVRCFPPKKEPDQ